MEWQIQLIYRMFFYGNFPQNSSALLSIHAIPMVDTISLGLYHSITYFENHFHTQTIKSSYI